ncbi:hypothetical protein B7494_g739 [Chlorociboria aeruginascens]|nr:hypothetical protein B7494_g739 [Chlorociboria aeruginascens]
MAAPAEITLKDLSGDWVMNKTLSDDTDALLTLQGVGWFTRKAISLSTITLHTKQYTDDKNTVHIDIDQTLSGGISGTSERRTLDWTEREHEDHIFGKLTGKTRWLDLDAVEDPYMKDGWLSEGEQSGPGGETHIETFVENKDGGWTADQIWGFVIIDGVRYYTRRVVVKKGEVVVKARLVYDRQKK